MNDHDCTEGSSVPDEEFLKWSQPPRPSNVTRNKNKKTISVSNAFNMNEIPVKVIASYEKWLEFENVYLRAGHIDRKAIRKYISRPKKEILEKLEEYYADLPQRFSNFFYNYYIIPANAQNPKWFNARKSRGTYYGLDRFKMYKIRIAAAQVYVYLKHWVLEKSPSEIPPPEFVELNKRDQIHPNMLISTTMELTDRHFGIGLKKIKDEKIFYNNFIASRRLIKTFEDAFSKINYKTTIILRNHDKSESIIPVGWAKPLLEVLKSTLKTPQNPY